MEIKAPIRMTTTKVEIAYFYSAVGSIIKSFNSNITLNRGCIALSMALNISLIDSKIIYSLLVILDLQYFSK